MMPVYHVIASTAISAGLFGWLKSWPATIACFLSGIFIDLDHHVDYFLSEKRMPKSFRELVEFCEKNPTGKLYLIFHFYELLAFLWAGIYFLRLGDVWVGMAVGLTTHMIFDQITNPLKPLAYFMFYRIKHQFNRKFLHVEGHFE